MRPVIEVLIVGEPMILSPVGLGFARAFSSVLKDTLVETVSKITMIEGNRRWLL